MKGDWLWRHPGVGTGCPGVENTLGIHSGSSPSLGNASVAAPRRNNPSPAPGVPVPRGSRCDPPTLGAGTPPAAAETGFNRLPATYAGGSGAFHLPPPKRRRRQGLRRLSLLGTAAAGASRWRRGFAWGRVGIRTGPPGPSSPPHPLGKAQAGALFCRLG